MPLSDGYGTPEEVNVGAAVPDGAGLEEGTAVTVTVTSGPATVTVTGLQPPEPAPGPAEMLG